MMKEEVKIFLRSGFISTRELNRDMGENTVLKDISTYPHGDTKREVGNRHT